MPENVANAFFQFGLPRMAQHALQLPELFSDGKIHLSKRRDPENRSQNISLTEPQARGLVVAGFLCIAPESSNERLPELNFRKFFRNSASVASQLQKLLSVLQYFQVAFGYLNFNFYFVEDHKWRQVNKRFYNFPNQTSRY